MEVWNDPDQPTLDTTIHMVALAVLLVLAGLCLAAMGVVIGSSIGICPATATATPSAVAILPRSIFPEA